MASPDRPFHGGSIRPEDYRERTYRQLVRSPLIIRRVTVQETDISLHSTVETAELAKEAVIEERGRLESYIRQHPQFLPTLAPWPDDPLAPPIVREMIAAGQRAGVGPMAAVAGAIAERVGRRLLSVSPEVIVENGGDIFLRTKNPLSVGLFAGVSPLSLKIGIRIEAIESGRGICTSSATVGHSLSFGKADAVCVLSPSCALADAVATAVGNRVNRPADIQPAIQWGKAIAGIEGLLIVIGEKLGAWGKIKIIPL